MTVDKIHPGWKNAKTGPPSKDLNFVWDIERP